MSTFQKIRFVLTNQQLFKVLGQAGAINGLVLDLSVKENYVTVIDVNGYKYEPGDDVLVVRTSGESAIPTPPGGHGTTKEDLEIINLKGEENSNTKNFFESNGFLGESKSFENFL